MIMCIECAKKEYSCPEVYGLSMGKCKVCENEPRLLTDASKWDPPEPLDHE